MTCGFGVFTQEKYCTDPIPVDDVTICILDQKMDRTETCNMGACLGKSLCYVMLFILIVIYFMSTPFSVRINYKLFTTRK